MPFEKSKSGNPAGRPVGSLNKSTQAAREAIALFVEGNSHRLTGWLDEIAKENPKEAFAAFVSILEYTIPKLARGEVTAGITDGWQPRVMTPEELEKDPSQKDNPLLFIDNI